MFVRRAVMPKDLFVRASWVECNPTLYFALSCVHI